MRDATLEAVARQFRPEFINRIHEQIVFHPLSEVDVRRVLRPLLGQICQNLEQQYGVSLLVDPNVEILLARIGHSLLYGIRELRRVVEKYVQVPLSQLILDGKLIKGSHWQLVADNGDLMFAEIRS